MGARPTSRKVQPRKKGNHALSSAELVKQYACCGGGTVLYGKRGGYVYLRSTKSICFFGLARSARCYGFHGRERRSSSCTPFRIGEGVPFSDVLHACVSCNPICPPGDRSSLVCSFQRLFDGPVLLAAQPPCDMQEISRTSSSINETHGCSCA